MLCFPDAPANRSRRMKPAKFTILGRGIGLLFKVGVEADPSVTILRSELAKEVSGLGPSDFVPSSNPRPKTEDLSPIAEAAAWPVYREDMDGAKCDTPGCKCLFRTGVS